MTTRDTHTHNTYNSYHYHQGQGRATNIRDQQDINQQQLPTREQYFDQQEQLYNKQSYGAPLTNQQHKQHHAHENHGERGIATQVNPQVPPSNIVAKDTRSALKDALANAHGVSRPQDFPAHQQSHPHGLGSVATKPEDTPLFVPQIDPSPKRRLHQLSDEYLQKIWKEDERKDVLANKMEANVNSTSPMHVLRRGGADTVQMGTRSPQRIDRPVAPTYTTTSGSTYGNGGVSPSRPTVSPRSIAELGADTDRPQHVHGCRHNPDHLKSNVPLSSDVVTPVLSGRRRVEAPQTKGSIY